MKKIMIVAAIVMTATFSQAAALKWKVTNLSDPTGAEKVGSNYVGYFIDAASVDQATAIANIQKGDLSFITSYGEAEKSFTKGVATTTIADNVSAGYSRTGYMVVVDNATLADATYAYVSTVQTGEIPSSGAGVNISWDSSVAGTGNWYAVPEPTSGLLLLLGVGALALRRRRA